MKKYIHNHFQDDIFNIMEKQVLRKKLYNMSKSGNVSLMCDEYTGVSNKRQLSLCARWVDTNLNACENFFWIYEVPNIKSETIVKATKYVLMRFNLALSNLRGKRYNYASNMLGNKRGVAQ